MADHEQNNGKPQSCNSEKIEFSEEDIPFIVKADKLFGLRAIGIILYGALPSYLALVGVLDIKIHQFDDFFSPLCIILVSILPISLAFILIRNLHREWYLTSDHLNFRSAFTTFMILLISFTISEISGVIHNKYVFGMPNIWEWKPIVESFLTAIFSIVLTSTFVLTSFTREINVPGIPSIEYTTSMKILHKMIKQMKNEKIWNQYDSNYSDLINSVESIEKRINDILALQSDYLSQLSLNPVKKDILNLKKVLIRIKRKMLEEKADEWKLFFENSNKLNDKENLERYKSKNIELFESVERLRELKLEDLTCQMMISFTLRFLHSIQTKLTM